ncbi:MAG: response regulator [Asticcacaulis sp.]|nr:response regulator [Asticcacaulis sp.]
MDSPGDLEATLNGPAILLVDDNPDDRERYVRALRKIEGVDYRYREAAGGESMLKSLAEARPDCVLLDYSLPGRNGLDLLRDVVTQYPFLPVIIMTGQGNENIAVQSIKDGAQHYLVKADVTPDLLHETITAAIRHRALEYERGLLIEKLTASNTELERFAYVASHDLQEPIRMVASFGQVLKQDYGDRLDDAGREYLDIVLEASQRMHGMIGDLLTYSRVGSHAIESESFDGNATLKTALDNLRELIRERSAEIEAAVLPQLYGNPIQLSRLLQNLIANAIKYQARGNVPHIRIQVSDLPGHWQLSVADNGMGIEPRYLDQIFQPFRRLHVWESVQGTGLGLSICKKIVENHGGEIWAESLPGQGATFHFTLKKPRAGVNTGDWTH